MKNPGKACATYGPGRPSETEDKAFRRVFAGIDKPARWTPTSTAVASAAAPSVHTVASSPDGGSGAGPSLENKPGAGAYIER